MKKTLSNGFFLNYEEHNENADNTLLFLHGNSHSHKSFNKQAESALLKDYRMVLLDLPGHGESSTLNDYSLPIMSEIIAEFIVAKKFNNFAIVGHSLGGHVGVHSLHFVSPKGLMIFGTPPLSKPFDPSSFLSCPEFVALLQPESSPEEINSLMDILNYSGKDREDAIDAYRKTDPNFRATIFAGLDTGNYFDEINLLKEYQGHVHTILSDDETLVNNSYIKKNLSSREHSSIISRHSPQVDQFDTFNSMLNIFCHKVFR